MRRTSRAIVISCVGVRILRVAEDEVFEMDEFAFDPQRGPGIDILRAFEKAGADRRAGDPLIETRERDTGVESRPH